MRFKLDNLQLFAESMLEKGTLYITFDSNITKVVIKAGDYTNEYATSDTSGIANFTYTNKTTEVTVTLKDGYILDSVTSSGTISNKTDNSFTCDFYATSDAWTITLTSKLATTRLSYDLTKSATNWANLTDGEHIIQIVAKGTGYRNSALSSAVTFTKRTATAGETWVLNETIEVTKYNTPTVDLIAENVSYYPLIANNTYGDLTTGTFNLPLEDFDPENRTIFFNFGNRDEYQVAYSENLNKWISIISGTEYITTDTIKLRTLVFQTAPSGDLLTWLQNNGTKQNGG